MNIDVVGVPIDLGSDRRGVDMGPSVIRYSGLIQAIRELNISCRDLGNISVPVPQDGDNGTSHFPKARFVNEITKTNEVLFHTVARSLREGSMPLVLGGDHSIATGSILGVQSVKKNIG